MVGAHLYDNPPLLGTCVASVNSSIARVGPCLALRGIRYDRRSCGFWRIQVIVYFDSVLARRIGELLKVGLIAFPEKSLRCA